MIFGSRPAVVVIDFQKGFTHAGFPGGSDMRGPCRCARAVIDAAREKEIKIFYVRMGYRRDGVDLLEFGKKCTGLKQLYPDTWEFDIDEDLEVTENDILIHKHWCTAFFDTPLVQMLHGLQIDTVIFCGCSVGGCLYASAMESSCYGFHTVIVKEAVADRSEEIYETFLDDLGQKYADIETMESVIEKIGKLNQIPYHMLDEMRNERNEK
ncbi:isochorismatase family protein [Clostridium sp. AM58-1XD]|nr:isochorismatase family protein [Clostridium sp. AM58-1XD]